MKFFMVAWFMLLGMVEISAQVDTVLWTIDNLTEIGGHPVQLIGEPLVIETAIGNAIEFDGVDDGLIVENNPLSGATAFTVEIIFKPYSGGDIEQRFLHMQQDNDNRMLIELRNNNDENWSLDTFIKSGGSSKTLLDYEFTHDLDTWTHAALVYQNGLMEHFVNGVKELEGAVDYQEVSSGQTSLGVRLNQVSWFKGAIHTVRVTHAALNPEDFLASPVTSPIQHVQKDPFASQIIPNPLDSNSLLKYHLDKGGKISIDLLDAKGQLLNRIFSGYQAAGAHNCVISKDSLRPGAYFVRLTSDQRSVTVKCVQH